MNSVGGAEAAEDGERLEVRQAAQRGGVEPSPGPTGRGGDVGAQVEAGGAVSSGASSHCMPGHDMSV
jgi:hypothetical protein